MKKIVFRIALVLSVCIAAIAYAAQTSAVNLMNLGMPAELANYISTALVQVNSSGNLVLPVASGKKLSITVAGTELAALSSAGVFTSTGLAFPAANFEDVAGAGSTVSDAAALSATKHIHQLTGANGTLGWKFTTSTAGQFEILLNTTAGVPKVYAASGGTCNGGAADAACTLVTGIVAHLCYSTAADTWICS